MRAAFNNGKSVVADDKAGLRNAAVVAIIVLSFHVWEVRYLPQALNIENMLVWAIGIYSFFMARNTEIHKFRTAILIFVLGIVANTAAAYINLGQNPVKTLLSFEFSWFIMLYFFFHLMKPDRTLVEKIIVVSAVIYSVLFIVQYAVYPFVIFRSDKNTAVWSKQFEIMGNGFLMLGYFLFLNRFLLKQKFGSLLMALFFFVVLFYSDFRTLIFGAALVTVYLLVRIFHKPQDLLKLFVVGLLFLAITQQSVVSKMIEGMVTKTQSDIKEGKKYVRLMETEFFYKKYPQNFSYWIIGGGRPSGPNLFKYNKSALRGINYNIVWVDIGLLGFYMVIGGIATLGLLLWVLRAIIIRLPRDRIYLNAYFLYLLVVSFTNEEIYRNGIFTVQALALYLIDITIQEQKQLNDADQAAEKLESARAD